MKKVNIPEIGTVLTLEEDWSFKLVLESRNNSLIEKLYPDYATSWSYYQNFGKDVSKHILEHKDLDEVIKKDKSKAEYYEKLLKHPDLWIEEDKLAPVVFPVDTELKVDRIYIRKGKDMSDYSSVSFWAKLPGEKKKFRFFAKLADVNYIVYG